MAESITTEPFGSVVQFIMRSREKKDHEAIHTNKTNETNANNQQPTSQPAESPPLQVINRKEEILTAGSNAPRQPLTLVVGEIVSNPSFHNVPIVLWKKNMEFSQLEESGHVEADPTPFSGISLEPQF